jgi:fatty-acid peroxygenase
MTVNRRPLIDRSLAVLAEGYAWLPNRMRDSAEPVLCTRVLGRPALAVRGPDAVRFFYDEDHVRRHGALPEPVRATLFGQDPVHTLDGDAHRTRKRIFLPLLSPDRVTGIVEEVVRAWDDAVPEWAAQPRITLFDEAGTVLTRGICRWAGVPLPDGDAAHPGPVAKVPSAPGRTRGLSSQALAVDLLAMVDGFATAGPRHFRARRARNRQEARLAHLVDAVRAGTATAPTGSVLDAVCRHRDADGEPLGARTAAVELLNVLRPTAAVAWFVAFAAHALHRWPAHREPLRDGDPAFATAFAHEVRRFYPFAPFLGGLAVRELSWRGATLPEGGIVLLDVYGQNHDEKLWGDPYAFRPQRFLDRPAAVDALIPQGGGDPHTNHRCPGENVTIGLLEALAVRLARLEYTLPEQDLTIPLRRIPTRPRSGVVLTDVRADPAAR